MHIGENMQMALAALRENKMRSFLTVLGVEFMLPNPTFWRVAFPPTDWTPRHPDAKSG